ncbi:MAG: hypothetical protein AAF211_15430 [Myxococcota bacterium]
MGQKVEPEQRSAHTEVVKAPGRAARKQQRGAPEHVPGTLEALEEDRSRDPGGCGEPPQRGLRLVEIALGKTLCASQSHRVELGSEECVEVPVEVVGKMGGHALAVALVGEPAHREHALA